LQSAREKKSNLLFSTIPRYSLIAFFAGLEQAFGPRTNLLFRFCQMIVVATTPVSRYFCCCLPLRAEATESSLFLVGLKF